MLLLGRIANAFIAVFVRRVERRKLAVQLVPHGDVDAVVGEVMGRSV